MDKPKTVTINGRTDSYNRRAWVSMALAIASFAVLYVATWPLARFAGDGSDGWASLGYFAFLLLGLWAVVWVAIPVVVHTVGRRIDRATAPLPVRDSAWRFAAAGAVLGLVPALVAIVAMPVVWWLPLVNFVVPAALGGLLTNVTLPFALRSQYVLSIPVALSAVAFLFPVVVILGARGGA